MHPIFSSDSSAAAYAVQAPVEKRVAEDVPEGTSAPASNHPRQLRKHEGFWDSGQFVVVEVQGVMFRLHGPHLASKSSYFKKLLERPPSGSFESDPLYAVDRGTSDDFAALLKAMDNGLSVHYGYKIPPFSEIAPILRAASLYDFPDARGWAETIATKHYWPSGVDGETIDGMAVDAVVIGRTCGVPSILKGALYDILRSPLFDGLTAGADDRLPAADRLRLLRARTILQQRWVAEALSPPSGECCGYTFAPSNCTSQKTAEIRVGYWMQVVHASGEFELGLLDPISALNNLGAVDWQRRAGYCLACAARMKGKWGGLRARWWDELDRLLAIDK